MLECPKCSFIPPNPNVRFCPNCGGKRIMDGETVKAGKSSKPKSAASVGRSQLLWTVVVGLVGVGIVYVGLFVILTFAGHAEQDISGTFRNAAGTPIYDIEAWQPAGMHVTRYRELTGGMVTEANVGGWFFLPMVIVDRRWWHHSRSLVEMPKPSAEGANGRPNP